MVVYFVGKFGRKKASVFLVSVVQIHILWGSLEGIKQVCTVSGECGANPLISDDT
jgi:hypothetical protein